MRVVVVLIVFVIYQAAEEDYGAFACVSFQETKLKTNFNFVYGCIERMALKSDYLP